MASYQVRCITKPNVNSTHEHITAIGYYDGFNVVTISVEEAIRRIDLNRQEFHVQVTGGFAYVKVERPANRRAFIKTVNDYTQRDNLLHLPQCG